jgi:antitoxin VapB
MGKEWPARSFKSGNSVAIRVPAALGVEPNKDWTIEERSGELILRQRDAPKRKIDLTGIWGSCPGLRPLTREEREFDPSPRIWDDPDWSGWKGDPSQ